MDKFKIRNSEQGMDRPFGIVMTKDNKCLQENGEISVRNCDNVKNQYGIIPILQDHVMKLIKYFF